MAKRDKMSQIEVHNDAAGRVDIDDTGAAADALEAEVQRYMALPYRIELTPDDGGWFVRVPDLPYCMSQGETVEEAMEMIRDAMHGWLTVSIQHGDVIPEPAEPTYSEERPSGRFNIRLPRTIHRDLARLAEDEGVSLNLMAATILAQALGRMSVEARKPGRPPVGQRATS